MNRCGWPGASEQMIKYHDEEWGKPVHDDRLLFEYMLLDAFQAGLSWRTILHKRCNFRKAFDNFNAKKIVNYTEQKLEALRNAAGIIRNKLKISATVTNAQAFLDIQKEFSSFDKYIWGFVGGKTIVNTRKKMSDIVTSTKESDIMSKDLKKRSCKFVGTTICYAFMQAAGLVNDHTVDCFRYNELTNG